MDRIRQNPYAAIDRGDREVDRIKTPDIRFVDEVDKATASISCLTISGKYSEAVTRGKIG
jgi:hypothetical protein